jgi:c-di-GMP-binding flagellar brake protein YcgR
MHLYPTFGTASMEKLTGNNPSELHARKGLLALERRKYPRFNVELPLDYSRTDGEETYGGIVANASEGGILVYLPERIEVGALLKIEIIYVRGLELDTIKATVKVVWSDLTNMENWGEHRYGLQFQSIDEKDFGRLKMILKEA